MEDEFLKIYWVIWIYKEVLHIFRQEKNEDSLNISKDDRDRYGIILMQCRFGFVEL